MQLAIVVLSYSQEVAESRHEPRLSEIRVQTPNGLVSSHSTWVVLHFCCCFYQVTSEINNRKELLMSEKFVFRVDLCSSTLNGFSL